uniref:Uncharacterized protein n=1 Tax=Anguilla anguilla TaxID=7936 RepID=A0A0E9QFJ4_ANGAN
MMTVLAESGVIESFFLSINLTA